MLTNDALGEVILYPAGPTPTNWIPCNGQSLKVADYEALAELYDAFEESFSLPVMHSPSPDLQYIICTYGITPLQR